ncbi:hypothetical protein [Kaarinaea lacus]
MKGTYYAPTGKNGHIMLSDCRGIVGYPSVFGFEYDQFKGEIHNGLIEKNNELAITVILYIAKGYVVNVHNKKFQIKINGVTKEYEFETIDAIDFGKAYSLNVTMNTSFSGSEHDAYHFNTALLKINSDQFIFVPPLFYINDELFDIGEVLYKKKSGWAIFPVNC